MEEKIKQLVIDYTNHLVFNESETVITDMLEFIDTLLSEINNNKEQKPKAFTYDIEEEMLRKQLVRVRVLSCKGDAEGKNLPTQILLQLGREIKWYEQTKLNKE